MPANEFSAEQPFFGTEESFAISTNNKEGINIAVRASGNSFMIDKSKGNPADVLYDIQSQLGASYILPINKFTIRPYLISKFNLFPMQFKGNISIRSGSYAPIISEINAGINLGANINNTNFSLVPYYAKRIWEQELGIDAKIERKDLELSAGGYLTKSNYVFCPDKSGFSVNATSSFKNFGITFSLKDDLKNYDGEISSSTSLSINGNIRY